MEDKDRAREFQANHSRFLLFSTLRQFLLFSTLSLLRQQSGKLFLIVGGGNSSLGSAFCLGHNLFLTLHWDTTWDTTCLGLNNQLQLFCFKPPKDCTSTRLEGRFQNNSTETCSTSKDCGKTDFILFLIFKRIQRMRLRFPCAMS